MSKKIDTDLAMAKLKDVQDPELNRSIVDLGMVEELRAEGSTLKVIIKLTIPGCPLKKKISDDIKSALDDIPEIENIEIEFTSMTDDERKKLTAQLTGKDSSEQFKAKQVKNVILIASGKGGVGKSTVTANLAVAASMEGFKVGVLDADIHGFSIPRILGVEGRPTIIDNTIIPLEKSGIRIMSMGFFIDESKAVIWRGPMIHKAVSQFLSDVFWDDLDMLFVDLPPGTGDVALSLAQLIPGVNAVLVTTPQPGAYIVASRIAQLAEKANIKMIGIIENMSYFLAPDGNKEYIFGSGGGQELAEKLNIPLLGQVPLETDVRAGGDKGEPIMFSNSNSKAALELKKAARGIIAIVKPELVTKTVAAGK
ncbi:MAG: P-loop NTPase [candidate division Zixibacteria bacterium]